MSNLISENKIPNIEKSKIEILIKDSRPDISNQNNSIIRENFKNYTSQSSFLSPVNKNGLRGKMDRKQINFFEENEQFKESVFFLKNIDYNYYISLLNESKNNFSGNDDYGNANLLESNQKNYEILGKFSKESDFETHLYKRKKNIKLMNEISLKVPLISRVFQRTNYIINNNMNKKQIFLEKEKNRKYISKSTEPVLLTVNAGIKGDVKIKSNSVNKDNNLKKSKLNKKIDFNNKDNFLLNYNIKEIIIKNMRGLEYKIPPKINLKDMDNFINNICNKIKNKNNSKNSLNISMGEFIEYNKINGYEEKDKNFLQKKRKNSLNVEEINDIKGKNKSKNKKHPLKKTHKKISTKIKNLNKNNNKKEGKSISMYLNKIEINKNSLENFPFYPSIRNKEITKVEFLKGIVIKKYSIRINKKAKLVKDQRNLEYINNKKFQIIYEKKESNDQIIININGFHILYLIMYYYYQMQKCIKQINKFHYSHANFNKTKNELKTVEEVIKKCNKIVHDITK